MKRLAAAMLGLTLAVSSVPVVLATEAEDVMAFLEERLLDADPGVDLETTRIALAFADLNGDGADEAIAYLMGPYWCGSGGCNAFVIAPGDGGFEVVMESTVTQTPIGVLKSTSEGWTDIFVSVGGGGMPGGRVAMRFGGNGYPANPTVDGEPIGKDEGKVLISSDDRGVSFE